MKRIFTAILLVAALWGCTSDSELPEPKPLPSEADAPAMQNMSANTPVAAPLFDQNTASWVRQQNDPYTLENFQRAYDNLLSGGRARGMTTAQINALSLITLEATHYNVKIFPKTEAEQRELEQDEDITIAYLPFDYVQLTEEEKAEMGSSTPQGTLPDQRRYTVTYDDLQTVEGPADPVTITMPVLYAVWPCSKPLPAGMDYEITGEVYLPEYGSTAGTRSALSGAGSDADQMMSILENEAVNLASGSPQARSIGIVGPPMQVVTPISGNLACYDDKLKKTVPLENLKVKVQYGSKIWPMYTDKDGNFGDLVYGSVTNATLSIELYHRYWRITTPDDPSPITRVLGQIRSMTPFNMEIESTVANELEIHRAVNYYFNGPKLVYRHFYAHRCKIVACDYGHPKGYLGCFYPEHKGQPAYIEIFDNSGYSHSNIIGTTLHELGHYTHFGLHGGAKIFSDDSNSFISKFLTEGYATFVGWYLCDRYYTSLGYIADPYYNITGQARQYWPYYGDVHLNYSPLFVDLVDNYNQPLYNGTLTVDDDIKDVPYSIIERIAIEAHNWAECKAILYEYADKPKPAESLPAKGYIAFPHVSLEVYYTTDQLNRMMPFYDYYFD